ncbi:citryl-CoA lyase (citrate lyase beta subunit; an ATP citrate synthase subunit) [Haladaptatus paucihalophilus DX253]|uniref:Citryl-CoA lyase (Citrate lyase beta subunit an ATP citrate synthase subunit) n=1 Tax=Haladaptatus paucihalophilus DX253 TaxID=797209 RepID=E7QWM0_HALPU|nr:MULTISPECIES: hypothetical protein [Haladaptatus]EFW91116.1 citryl-CoA lyase (citrate lyase beta subunit; an ATP citrate synthase subunit) [Haladaptatus paucihalophilus DX253]GKZ15288.1 hypothetical protein HAL_31690 [Haladaptatus sp. T7]
MLEKAIETSTETVVDFGFDGKLAVHPNQTPVINEAYTPSPDEIDWAERILDRTAATGIR